MQRPTSGEAGPRRGVFWIAVAALGVGAFLAWLSLRDPVFSPDAAYRVFFAERPVVKLGNRVWLPFVQLHIWLYYLADLPVAGLKLITVAYSAFGIACVGLYWRRALDSTAFGVFGALCFGLNALAFNTNALMQEPVGVALFFYFVWCASRDRPMPYSALAAGVAAMLTRDVYWIYLFAATLVDLAQRPWGRRRIAFYAALWAAPIVWMTVCIPALYLLVYGRLPSVPVEWPLMYNPAGAEPTLAETLHRLADAFKGSRAGILLPAVLGAAALLAAGSRRTLRKTADSGSFAFVVLRAAPIALAIAYGLIIAVDPWQESKSNRMGWPAVELCFLAAPLLLRAALGASQTIRTVSVALIAAGLLLSLNPNPASRVERSLPAERILAEHRKLANLLSASSANRASVCLLARDRWSVFTELGAPTFRHRQTYLMPENPVPEHCEFLVAEVAAEARAPGRFEARFALDTGDHQWTVYSRRSLSD